MECLILSLSLSAYPLPQPKRFFLLPSHQFKNQKRLFDQSKNGLGAVPDWYRSLVLI
jgi:hypothetical protein